jgi:hypothetical protein
MPVGRVFARHEKDEAERRGRLAVMRMTTTGPRRRPGAVGRRTERGARSSSLPPQPLEMIMTRGLGGHSPANISAHLKGIQFPATKQDLLRQARENGADRDVLETIGHAGPRVPKHGRRDEGFRRRGQRFPRLRARLALIPHFLRPEQQKAGRHERRPALSSAAYAAFRLMLLSAIEVSFWSAAFSSSRVS